MSKSVAVQVGKELKATQSAKITQSLFHAVSGLGTFGISWPWRGDDRRDQSHWPLPHIEQIWAWCGSEQRLQRCWYLHLRLLHLTWLNNWKYSGENPPQTCEFRSRWCLCSLCVSRGQSGQSLSVWFSLRQCWQQGIAFALPVNASLCSPDSGMDHTRF